METKKSSFKKTFFKILAVLIILGIGGMAIYFYVPYADSSIKAGQLNYVMHKGYIFKTYEGKLIQTGIKSDEAGGVQSNEFQFSIDNEKLAKELMNLAGQNVKLHYKEYYGTLPWRGHTRFIVDSIVSIDQPALDGVPIDPNALVNY